MKGSVVSLDKRIRVLCAHAVVEKDEAALRAIMAELRAALREHNEDLKLIVADYPFLLADLAKPAA
jgi:hypothetical protein